MTITATAHHTSAIVPRESLRTVAACPWCGNANRKRLIRSQQDPPVWMVRCPSCRLASTSAHPDAEYLKRYYSGYYDRSDPRKREGKNVTVGDVTRSSRHILTSLIRAGLAPADDGRLRVLDFGGGDGSLAESMAGLAVQGGHAESATVTVVDPNFRDRTAADPRIALESAPSVPQWRQVEGRVLADVTLASAVLEHLPQPRQILQELLLATRPGGLISVRTPWMAPLAVLLGRMGVRLDLTFPGHLHDMGGDFWSRAADYLEGVPAKLVLSQTSFVESSLRSEFARTVASVGMKVPSRLAGRRWPYCGGWEAVFRRL